MLLNFLSQALSAKYNLYDLANDDEWWILPLLISFQKTLAYFWTFDVFNKAEGWERIY